MVLIVIVDTVLPDNAGATLVFWKDIPIYGNKVVERFQEGI
jgi:hypothetical protein